MGDNLFALVDCNNFYVSCERLFDPGLAGRPVVVLSNNDGCVIARSDEAKGLGIPMGAPYFKYKGLLRRHRVRVFSSNYALYGDLSHRVTEVLRQLEPEVEVYSIDEAFIAIPAGRHCDPTALCRRMRRTVQQYTGIPVSIGLAPTKTLAKIANRFAKRQATCNGVFTMPTGDALDALLATVEVHDIWGIGRRYGRRLREHNIHTALALKNANDTWLRANLTVMGLRTARELRGISCIPLEAAPPGRKSIIHSRSFGRPVASLTEMKQAVASFTTGAAERLRAAHLMASCLDVFLLTNRFREDQPQHSGSRTVPLPFPTNHTPLLIAAALSAAEELYRQGHVYQKAGVMLSGLTSRAQQNLFMRPPRGDNALLGAVDSINRQWGRDTIQWATAGLQKPWGLKQQRKSPSYTTRWSDLPVAHAATP